MTYKEHKTFRLPWKNFKKLPVMWYMGQTRTEERKIKRELNAFIKFNSQSLS